ncbi:MAG: flagellar biosynthetic protein FliO [Planctomycetia bacterium]
MTMHRIALLAATIVIGLATGAPAAESEPPVAPSPDAPVQPAAFSAPAAPAQRGGLPLTTDPSSAPPAAGPTPVPQPVPDWRLLAAVAAAFAVLAGVRARAGRGRARLPADVCAVLGEAPLGSGQAVRIVRFGPKTLLVGCSSAGVRTLAEIADPQATDCIVAACRGAQTPGRVLPRPRPTAGPRATPAAEPAGEGA